MTQDTAEALAQFVKDHDTRFSAKAMGGEGESFLQLTELHGAVQEPIHSVEEFEQRVMTALSPGPTIQEAWEQWKTAHGS